MNDVIKEYEDELETPANQEGEGCYELNEVLGTEFDEETNLDQDGSLLYHSMLGYLVDHRASELMTVVKCALDYTELIEEIEKRYGRK